ncbi:MAG: RHS repeat-associated core domain-containing protein [Verrucomicrobiota bacterium JB023]|nr:RHS repeat-associated core domain-containing protein [Verrucomicrobiota bacterium JB023]
MARFLSLQLVFWLMSFVGAQTRETVTFRYEGAPRLGYAVFLSGSLPELGEFDLSRSLQMPMVEEDVWEIEVSLPVNREIEYQFYSRGTGQTQVPDPEHGTTLGERETLSTSTVVLDPAEKEIFYRGAIADPVLHWRQDEEGAFATVSLTALEDGFSTGAVFGEANREVEFFFTDAGTGTQREPASLGGDPDDDPTYATELDVIHVQDGEVFAYRPAPTLSPPQRDYDPSSPPTLESEFLEESRPYRVFLPRGYAEQEDKYYPVLYVFDGQNVVDEDTTVRGTPSNPREAFDPDGETLSATIAEGLAHEVIVVGIDHTDALERLTLYAPFTNADGTPGNVEDWARFLRYELKPLIEERYRVLGGAENTAVVGMDERAGTALYMAWEYPELFGKVGLISAQNYPQYFDIILRGTKSEIRLYLDSRISGFSQVRDFRTGLLGGVLGGIGNRFIYEGDLFYQFIPTNDNNPEDQRARFPDLLAALFPATEDLDTSAAASANPLWLANFGLTSSAWDLDLDDDGWTTREEYAYGSNPVDPASRPDYAMVVEGQTAFFDFLTFPGARYTVLESPDLENWVQYPTVVGDGDVFYAETILDEEAPEKLFFRFRAEAPVDSDFDGLSDVEEGVLIGSRVDRKDTDGDGFEDGEEVLYLNTDPLVPNTTGGSISGQVLRDENGDGDLVDGTPIAGATVFIDENFNGELDEGESSRVTDGDGNYTFSNLAAGNYRLVQVLASGSVGTYPGSPPGSPDGLPDRIVSFDHVPHDIYDVPYGKSATEDHGVLLPIFPTPASVPVDVELLLKPIGERLRTFPLGLYNTTEMVSLTKDSQVTVEFEDELIVDGPGFDFSVVSPDGANAGELAEVYAGASPDDLHFLGVVPEGVGYIGFDFARTSINFPVRYLSVKSLSNGGSYPGYELVGFEAVHYQALPAGVHEVVLPSGGMLEDVDFGRFARDLPPRVFLAASEPSTPLPGEELIVEVAGADDFDIPTLSLTANGVAIPLDGEGKARVAATYPGELLLEATAEDSIGQTATRQLVRAVLNSDGSLPENPAVPSREESVEGAPRIVITSPGPGAVLSEDTPIVGSITDADGIVSWEITHAPIELVDPYQLAEPDEDYVLLASGTGEANNSLLATFPVSSLPDGVHLLRIAASDPGHTAYQAFVVGKNVDPEELYPHIAITAPEEGAEAAALTEVRGTITSESEIREWYVEYAPLGSINQSDLANTTGIVFERIGEGTGAVEVEEVLALFDPSLLPNDSYAIKVTAWNDLGLGWTEAVTVNVCGEFKPGRLRLEFTDLEVDLAGIPLTITRNYDSFDTDEAGDFGHGWRFGIADPEISETDPDSGAALGTNAWKVGTRVYLNTPDGKRVGFTFGLEVGESGFLGTSLRAVFTPDPGVYETLSVPEGDASFLSQSSDGSVRLFFIGLPYNPDVFVLTTKDQVSYTYHETDGLLDVRDEVGNSLVFDEDRIFHSSGAQVLLARDGENRITSITAPDGTVWSYGYNALGELETVTDPAGLVTSFAYLNEPSHYLESVTDPLGRVGVRYEYDEDGRLAAVIDQDGNRSEQTWDLEGFSGTQSDFRGNVTTIYYNDRGNVTRQENPDGGVEEYEYADADNPDLETRFTDALGNATTYQYDDNGNMTRLRPPAGNSLDQEFDENNRVTTRAYPTYLRDEFTYNELGKVAAIKNYREYTYTADGRIATEVDAVGNHRSYGYGGPFGELDMIENQSGACAMTTFTGNGLPLVATTPFGTESYTYDDSGRLLTSTDAYGAVASVTYEGEAVATITDENGIVTSFDYDFDGRLLSETTAGATTTYTYDADGNRTSVTDPLGNLTSFTFDHRGNVLTVTDPAGAITSHAYDLAGNRIQTIDRLGRKRTFDYDANGQMTAERWHDPVDDSVLREITFTYDYGQNLDVVTDGDLIYDYTSILSDVATSMNVTLPGRDSLTVRYTFEDRDRLTNTSLPHGASISYGRNNTGEVTLLTVRSPVSAESGRAEILRNAGRLPETINRYDSPVFTSTNPPIDTTTFTYDGNARLASMSQAGLDLDFARNAGGQISSITENASEVTGLSYGPRGQLVGVDHPAGADEVFTWDANGNAGGDVLSAGNRVEVRGNFEFDWDAEGNLVERRDTVSGEVRRFYWDYRNRLVKVELLPSAGGAPDEVVEYQYDYRDLRIGRTENGSTVWTVYDRHEMPLLEYRDEEELPETLYFFEPDSVDRFLGVWRKDEGLRWFHTDQSGSVRQVLDETGAVIATLDYDAFGGIRSLTEVSPGDAGEIRYAGRWTDPVTGLSDNRARFYDPQLGRFLNEDPLGFDGGDSNIYRYSTNDPYNYRDPSGLVAAVNYSTFTEKIAKRTIKYGKKVGQQISECFTNIAKSLQSAAEGGGAADTGACTKTPGLP